VNVLLFSLSAPVNVEVAGWVWERSPMVEIRYGS
jgi:hypothetical protein